MGSQIENTNYRDIFNNILDSVVILNDKGNIIDVNESVTQLTGYNREELLRMNVSEMVALEDAEKSGKYFEKLVREGFYSGYTGRIKRKDGDYRYVEINSTAFYDDKGKMTGSRDILRDISLKIEIENALKESEVKFRTIIENSDAIFFMIGRDGLFSMSEGKALRLLNLRPGQVVGLSVFDVYRDSPEVTDAYKSALSGERVHQLMEVNGFFFQTFFSPFRNSSGEICAVLGTAIDVSDRVKREQLLEEARIKAEEADMLKSSFLANMSHEIRTPMNAILGFSALLNDENLERETRKTYINIINAKGNELLALLTDLIDIAKIESGTVAINPEPYRIKDLVKNMADETNQFLLVQKRGKIKIEYLDEDEGESDLKVLVDKARFSQVLTNLLQNAIKFSDKGKIYLGFNKGVSGFVNIFVKDEGIGIPPDKHQLIFERFRQVQESMTRSKGGTGLGLYISKVLVELMGGEIWLESEPGEGSCFYFSVPLTTGKVLSAEKILPGKQDPGGYFFHRFQND